VSTPPSSAAPVPGPLAVQTEMISDVPSTPRPAAATSRGSLLLAELGRLRRRRLVSALVLLGLVALLAAMTTVFVTHHDDVAAAHAAARQHLVEETKNQETFRQQCLTDPHLTQSDKDQGACDYGTLTEDMFFADPRFRADPGLPMVALGVGVGGALLAALIAATASGADWSSRSMITLLTWETRRLRFLGTRLLAVGLYVAGLGVVSQAFGLGLAALTVQLRGTWQDAPPPAVDSPPDVGMLALGRFWPELLSLQLRAVLVMVLVAVMATALATVFRSTGGVLGVAFGWFAVAEIGVHALFGNRSVVRFMLTENLTAALSPGGTTLYVGQHLTPEGMVPRVVHLSNLAGLGYLAVVAVVLCAIAAVLLRRRDL
jgi:ABC-2 type transport system permease protein